MSLPPDPVDRILAAPPRFSEDDVGSIYLDEYGEVWRLIAIAREPTATLQRLEDAPPPGSASGMRPGSRREGVIGSPLFAGLRKLVPEGTE